MLPSQIPEQSNNSVDRENVLSNLKSDINDFLISRVPDELTVKEMDVIAMRMYDSVQEAWDKFC